MTATTRQGKTTSLRKRNFLVACAVAVCVIVIYVLWRANVLPNPFDTVANSRLTTMHAQASALPNAAVFGAVGASGTAQILAAQNSRAAKTDWQLFLDKLTRLLKGPKVEVCGLSDFEAAKYIAGDPEIDDTALITALAALRAQMAGREKPHDKAFGLYVEARLAEWAAIAAYQAKARICGIDFDCMINILNTTKTFESAPASTAASIAPLVALALAERDPAIIAAALYACRGDRTGACATISHADWVAVEPDNAAAWLQMADDASLKNEPARRDDALRRAAAASGYDLRVPSLASVWNADLIQSQSPLVLSSIGLQLASSQINTTFTPISAMVTYCRPDGLDDAHKKLCDTLANKLLDQDDSVIGLSMATIIGKKIGWDEARLQVL